MIPTKSSTRPMLYVVVLSAGLSARLGRPKALARVHGISLIRSTLRALAGLAAAAIIVVIPPRALRLRAELRGLRVTLAENRTPESGLSSSIRRGLTAARAGSAALLLPVDLVRLRRGDLERMITRWMGARRRVVARRIGSRGGTPLILPRGLYRIAKDIRGDAGLRDAVSELPGDRRILIDLPSAQLDVDTAADLARARARARR